MVIHFNESRASRSKAVDAVLVTKLLFLSLEGDSELFRKEGLNSRVFERLLIVAGRKKGFC